MGKAKNLLLITSIALVLIGISYAMASQQVFGESVRIDAQLVESCRRNDGDLRQ